MDIILTGIARSGTTLTCALLNRLPQCIALHEPMNPADLVDLQFPEAYLAHIGHFFAAQRRSLTQAGTAVSKARGGRVPDNTFEPSPVGAALRPSTVETQVVRFQKELSANFRLIVKHPNFFTATLATLLTRYPCFAIVRNPLAALLSWHTIQAPPHEGRLPYGEAFDNALKVTLAAEPDRLERQVMILRWYFSRYASLLHRDCVIRYEDLVATGGRALAVIDPDAATLSEPLESRNTSQLYDSRLVRRLADRLLADETVYGEFYTAEEVAVLRDAWLAGAD